MKTMRTIGAILAMVPSGDGLEMESVGFSGQRIPLPGPAPELSELT
jgi:hypothetical protein